MYSMKVPANYIQDYGILKKLNNYIPSWVGSILIVISDNGKLRYEEEINSLKVLHSYEATPASHFDCIIGIGGGSILDQAKCYCASIPDAYLILIPTIASNDSSCTSMIVPKKYDNRDTMITRLHKCADLVLVDLSIIANSDRRYLISGVCDASSKYFENLGCVLSKGIPMSHNDNNYSLVYRSVDLQRSLYKYCLEYFSNNVSNRIEDLCYLVFYESGIMSENGGLTFPHAFSLALDECTSSDKSHGEKVALGVLISEMLLTSKDYHKSEYYSLYNDILKLDFTLSSYGITSDNISDIVDSVMHNKLLKNFYDKELSEEFITSTILRIEG